MVCPYAAIFICAGITFKFYPRAVALSKNLKRLIIPYVLGCFVLLLFDLFLSRIILHNGSYDFNTFCILVKDYFGRMIYGSGMYGFTSESLHINFKSIGALWFFCALFVSKLIYNEISYFPQKWKPLLIIILFAFGYQSTACLTGAKGIWLPFSMQTGITAIAFIYMGELICKNMDEFEKHKRVVLISSMCIYAFVVYCGVSVGMVNNSYGYGYMGILGALCGTIVWIFFAKGLVNIPFISNCLVWIGQRTDKFLIFHLAELNFMPWRRILSVVIENIDSIDDCLCNIYIYAKLCILLLLLE